VQYTRNMVTGASTADIAIVLVDARHGLMEQTRRHTALAALLRVAHVVLAVNKMDLVDFSQETFDRIVAEFGELAAGLDVPSFQAIPLSALHGDNVVKHSPHLKWYTGPSLLEHLDTVSVESRSSGTRFRMSVQGVIRPRNAAYPDYRAYTGRIAAGELRVGQEIVVLPSGVRSTVEGIDTPDGSLDVAATGRSVAVRLSTEVDVARGDLLAAVEDVPEVTQTIRGRICVLADRVLRPGDRYGVRIGTREVRGAVVSMGDRWDAVTLTNSEAEHLFENDIGVVELRVSEPVALDAYESSPHTGSFLLVDDVNGATVAAGMALAS
jgi:sulfate adenylyltransferase subunit 1